VSTVLHLINTGGPGGAETVYVSLVRGLAGWRHVTVSPNREWMYHRIVELGLNPIVTRSVRSFDLRYLLRLYRVVREQRVDLVQGHLFGPGVTASLLGRMAGVPAVVTVHGPGDFGAQERYRALKLGLVNRGAARVVFVSEALRRRFLTDNALRPELTTVIPNGIDLSEFSRGRDDGLRRELGAGPADFVVGAIGNVREAKGYDVLLAAAARLKAGGAGFRFVIVGEAEGALYERLVALRGELGVEEEVRFLGFRDDVPRVLQALDAVAVTSRIEGFSLATVQAMAAGVPVVATRCGGPEEILAHGRTGLLVENGSPEAVATGLATLRSDAALREALGRAARRDAESRFTVEAQLQAYDALYRQCIEERGRRRHPHAPAAHRAPTVKTTAHLGVHTEDNR
jgi:glycosyltransferase involved in cell wall biosynthesis